ncbi:MAG: hypothetical protein AAGJ82_11565 [Bacteroidota bacterium]
MRIRSTYHSRLYRNFLAIEPKDYHGIIRYYEEHEKGIADLSDREQYELLLKFTHALFEVGAYRTFLAIVDQAVLVTLNEDNQPEFRHLLFRKAAAHVHVLEPQQAEHVCKELLRMDPKHEMALLLLRKTLRQQDRKIIHFTRPSAIFCFAMSALVILVEILFVRPFYALNTPAIEASRNFIFALGLLVLISGELLTLWRAFRSAQRFQEELS